MPTVLTTEPSSLVAGDTIAWTKSLPDYPATAGWALKYRLININGKIDITAAAAGADYSVLVSAATSAAYPPGAYAWQGYVEKSGDRATIGSGNLIIKPNLAAQAGGFDTRSAAKKTLEAMDIAMVAHGAHAWTQEYEMAGYRMKYRSPAEFHAMRNKLKAEVAREEAAERLAAGLGGKSKIYVRF